MSSHKRIQCKKVAVVLLGYNSQSYLARFIPSILATDYPDFDLVYVDNASTDDSVAFVERNFPQVKIFRVHENHGFTGGYTASLPYIDAEFYVLLNSDVEVEPDWLRLQMEHMDRDSKLGATQPKLLHEPKREQFDYAGASGGFIDHWGYPFCRGRIFDQLEADAQQYQQVRSIFWASGACMLVRAELYHRLGGLDPDFYAHMEEIDLCWRIHNAGYDIRVIPEAVVYHVGGSVITYGSYTKIFHNFRNNLVMMYKNLPASALPLRLGVRLLMDGLAAVKALTGGRLTEFKAIVAADLHFVFGLWKWRRNRKAARSQALPDARIAGVYPGSIVYDFFVRGKKKFSDIAHKMT